MRYPVLILNNDVQFKPLWSTRCIIPLLISRSFLLSYSKFPELFNSFKTLLGFKDPGLPEQLPTASPTPLHAPKERVTEFAAEIGMKLL